MLDNVSSITGGSNANRHGRSRGFQEKHRDETLKMNQFFETMAKVIKEGKQIIWQDETWTWNTGESDKLEKKWMMICHAGGKTGWVPNALYFVQGEMDWKNYLIWFKNTLIPSLKEPTTIVIDMAPWHSKQVDISRFSISLCPAT